jgi:DNA-binding CsgD family transcriptional regulator
MQYGVIALDARRTIEWATPYARETLTAWFGDGRAAGDRLPERLDAWLQQGLRSSNAEVSPAHRAPLEVDGPGGRLRVHWMPREDDGCWVVVAQPRSGPGIDHLIRLGLTQREAEVLSWIVEGKTNPEIAIILTCSTNTVRKHMEHILTKLGVETRGAAARRAMEINMSA